LRKTLALLLCLNFTAALALGGCSASGKTHRDPNTLVVMELGDADILSPLYSANYYATLYEGFVFDGLVAVGDNFTDAPDLATSWKGSADGKHWKVELRHGVRWSDGKPFTSKDVVYTWNVMLDPATAFPYRGQFAFVTSVKADGPYRVTFDLNAQNALFVSQALGAYILPEHVLGSVPHAQMRQSNFGEQPVGTGAYVLKEWRHDEQLTFERNPYWWGGAQSLPRIVVRAVINDQARIDAMEEGSADVDDGMGPSGYSILKQDRANLRLLHIPDLFIQFVYINFKRPGLSDLNVRRAMMYGWDRAGIANGFMRRDADVATSLVPDGLKLWYDPNVRKYPYDPARARRILDAAGYRLGRDGVRAKGPVRLSYVLSLPGSGTGSTQDFAAEFQADMREIGIAIDIRSIDYATFLGETAVGKYDLADSGWGGVPDPDQETLLDSNQFPPNGNNEMFYSNPRVDRDLRTGISTIGYRKRKPYYDDLQRIVAEDVPFLYYVDLYYRTALSPRVILSRGGILPDTYLFRDVAHWRLAQ
jgi:peptide/nickel transport system substrate-binding protein